MSRAAFALTRSFLESRLKSHPQRLLCQAAMDHLEDQTRSEELIPFVNLPIQVYAGITGMTEPAIPLACVTTLLFLGIDLLDDLHDGDLPENLERFPKNEVHLAAATLIASLPQIAVSELEVPATVRESLLATIAEGLLEMSLGQQRDLSFRHSSRPSPADLEEVLAAKSGSELEMFAHLAALLAGAEDKRVEAYASLGRLLGTAGQLASDCHDLFHADFSKDLANGTRTYPMALYLMKKDEGERRRFLELLDLARTDPKAREEIRHRLHREEILRLCAWVVEIHVERIRQLLERANPLEPGRSGLTCLVNHLSFY